MGQNRRYDLTAADVEKAGERLERKPRPVGPSSSQLRATGRRIDAQQPIAVTAWVPHLVSYVKTEQVTGEAIAWTDSAVLVRWQRVGSSAPMHTWVWASAVRRSRR